MFIFCKNMIEPIFIPIQNLAVPKHNLVSDPKWPLPPLPRSLSVIKKWRAVSTNAG